MLRRLADIAITPPLFGIPFGFSGLAGAWRLAGSGGPTLVADLLAGASAVMVVVLAIPWVVQLIHRRGRLRAELSDPAVSANVPVLAITAMVLCTYLLSSSYNLARALIGVFTALTLVGSAVVVLAWFATRLPLRGYHPGFYLATAGATLLSAQCVTAVGWSGLAQGLFFVGLASWLILGVVTSLRLARVPLAPALRPVVVIEIAAPALVGNSYAVVFKTFDGYALVLAAVVALMGIVQLGLTSYYRHAPFTAAFWAGAFSYATTASLALRWIDHEQPAGSGSWRALTLALASAVVVLLTGATIVAVRRGRFFTRATR